MVANASAAVQSKINLKAFEASNSGWAGVYSSIFFPRCIQQYFVGQESVDWVPYFYTCVLILLYTWQSLWIGPHATIYVSSYYYICADSVDWAVDTNYAKGSDAPGTCSKASSKSSSKDAAAVDTNYAKGSDAPGTRSKASCNASSNACSKDAAAALIP